MATKPKLYMNNLREKVVVLIHFGERYLFTLCREQSTGLTWHIPVGGGIEPGESPEDAARRDVMEETGQEIADLTLRQVSEEDFDFNGVRERETVYVYEARFNNSRAYTVPLEGLNDKGEAIRFTWKSREELEASSVKLFPSTILSLLP
jgi:ADP-ribose pyrophosphatase YjhB (NUDIX family)